MKIELRIRVIIAASITVAAITLLLFIAAPEKPSAITAQASDRIVQVNVGNWTVRLWDGSANDNGTAVWGDGSSNIYTCGSTARYGTGSNILLVKWDTVGNQIWNRTLNDSYSDAYGKAVWGDGVSSIYTCGYTGGPYSYSSMVLVKWDTDGNLIWIRTWNYIFWNSGNAVWGDDTGNIYVCGSSMDDMTLVHTMVLVKWDTDGNQVWNRTWGVADNARGNALWGDGKGNVYTCGSKLISDGSRGNDLVLIKWDAAGNQVWSRLWDHSYYDYGNAVWGDGTGNIYTCGNTKGSSIGENASDMVLVKWDEDGAQVWNRTWGGSDEDRGNAVWGDGTGNINICGSTMSFSLGGYDIVLVKWNTAGNQLWNSTWGGVGNDYGNAIWGIETHLYICGSSGSFSAGSLDMVLLYSDFYAPFPTSLTIGITVGIGTLATAITLGIILHKKRPHRVKERARRKHWSVKKKGESRIQQVVYRRQEIHSPEKLLIAQKIVACQNCGQQFPRGFEKAAYCPYCGHATKQTGDKTRAK